MLEGYWHNVGISTAQRRNVDGAHVLNNPCFGRKELCLQCARRAEEFTQVLVKRRHSNGVAAAKLLAAKLPAGTVELGGVQRV